jgi:hypothetical protein
MTYKVQIDDLIRDATKQEIDLIELEISKAAEKQAELEVKAAAKAALLERLGITAEEAALLLA